MLPTTATICYGAVTLGTQMTTFDPVPSVATGGFAGVNLSCRYSLNLQQPLLVKYPSNNHGQRGTMST